MENFWLSLFDHKRDTQPKVVERSWRQICENFQNPKIRKEKDGLLFTGAIFDPAYRLKENVRDLSILGFDIDHEADFEDVKARFRRLNAAFAIYSTHSHLRHTDNNPNAEPRFRVVVPLRKPVPAKDFPNLWQIIKRITGLPFDELTKDASRMFYAPVKSDKNAPYVSSIEDGDFLDWESLPLETVPDHMNGTASGHMNETETCDFEYHEDRHAELCRRIEAQAKATGRGGFEMKCPVHNGNGNSSLFYSPDSRGVKCLKGCDYFQILNAFNLPDGKLPSREKRENHDAEIDVNQTRIKSSPKPDEKCFYGLAGDFVRLVEPHTEASLMALLAQFLVYFGSIVGRTAYFEIEGDRHYTNIFCLLVGNTASGRKGTSFGRVSQIFKGLDEHHEKECVTSGLASGEGLLYHVRDAQFIQKKNKDTGELEEIQTDAGVSDKRLLVVEGEFAQVLRVQGRESNTLSATIRNLWDKGTARSLTKNSPLKTTDAHVSIIGHITKDELLLTLSEAESGNGYANRFLFFVVERSRFLPFGGEISRYEIEQLQDRIEDAIQFARKKGRMSFSIEASRIWASNYERLETSRFGFLAKVTQRASPYVLRLSLIYALLDKSPLIEKPHLEAALSVWQYAEDSARYIFGERLADQTAERILTALKEAAENGLSRTEIRNLFDRHISNEKLNGALSLLFESGLAKPRKVETKGKPKEIWFACDLSVKSVQSLENDLLRQPIETSLTKYETPDFTDEIPLNANNALNSAQTNNFPDTNDDDDFFAAGTEI